jgi:hypothetical protein
MRDKKEVVPILGVNPIGEWDILHVGQAGGVMVDEDQMRRLVAEVLNRPAHCPGCSGNCEGIKQ